MIDIDIDIDVSDSRRDHPPLCIRVILSARQNQNG